MKTKILLVTLLLSGFAAAQQKYVALDVKGGTAACAKPIAALQVILADITPRPAQWTWVVACNDSDWQTLKSKAPNLTSCCAFTLIDKGFTFINGAALLSGSFEVTPHYVIAHELGHIATRSKKEADADAWAKARGYERGKEDNPMRAAL